jgi:hypothetical protein
MFHARRLSAQCAAVYGTSAPDPDVDLRLFAASLIAEREVHITSWQILG